MKDLLKTSDWFSDGFVESDFECCGYRCLVKAHPMGHRCGYVVLPQGHVLAGRRDLLPALKVHGGVTFFEYVGDEQVIGFDCGHLGDARDFSIMSRSAMRALEEFEELLEPNTGHLWTSAETARECVKLVGEIKSVAGES